MTNRLIFAALICAAPMAGYVRETYQGKPLMRAGSIAFMVGPHAKAGLQNAAGQTVITPESDPVAALQAAMATWDGVPGSDLNLNLNPVSADMPVAGDGNNVISFEDNAYNRSVVGSAIAITYYYVIPTQGVIIDSDIVFNPDMPFATTPTYGAFDLQAIATHELGHAIGVGHTPLRSAVMFPYSDREDTAGRALSQDDIAFVREVHATTALYGTVAGILSTPSGKPPGSALVVVLNDGGVIASAYSVDGNYSVAGVPAGEYTVAAYPVAPYLASSGSPDFETPDWQAAVGAQRIAVTGGNTAKADIAIADGPAKMSIRYALLGYDYSSYRVASGTAVAVGLDGFGFPGDIKPEDIVVFGGGASIRPETIKVLNGPDPAVSGTISFTMDLPPKSDWSEAAIVIRSGDLTAVHAGIRIAPAGVSFAPSGVANSASFLSGAIAPGELVSIFGTSIGPEKGVPAKLEPSGGFPTVLEGTSVEINDRPAPLIYVSGTQINAQVPFEVSGQANARVRVRHAGTAAEAILPVAASSPAIFGTYFGAAILNHNGLRNDTDHPATPGKAIIVFGTGQGVVDPALATNAVAPLDPLCRTPNVKASIGGKASRVDFSGMTPGFIGLWQLNITVPDDVAPGWDPIVLTVNDSIESPAQYVYVSSAQ